MPSDDAEPTAATIPDSIPPFSDLAGRWNDLHPDDQAVAAISLDALAQDLHGYREFERFVDLVLDLRPALERKILGVDQIRAAALALIEDERNDPPSSSS